MLLRFYDTKPVESVTVDVERLRDHLGGAIEISSGWASLTSPDLLRKSVAELHKFLIRHTGKGLVRASAATKSTRGRATDCEEFASKLLQLISGTEVPRVTISDAIKDVITRQRSVGSS
jgi:hypothetical protein